MPEVDAAALIGGALSIGSAIVSFEGSEASMPDLDAQTFSSFANISSAIDTTWHNAQTGVNNFIDSVVNNGTACAEEGYASDPNQIPQLLNNGAFFGGVPELSADANNVLVSVFAAPAINALWNESQVIVVKANKADFSTGDDPCGNGGIGTGDFAGAFPPNCDSEGNNYVLQSISADYGSLDDTQIFDPTHYAVPGFDNLGDFSIALSSSM